MKRLLVILVLSIVLSGCSILGHLDELLTLKGVGDEQAAMDKEVQRQNKKFALLVDATQKESFLKDYPTQDQIKRRFGEPIFSRPQIKDGKDLELWLYRKATQYFDGDKIYLYFDGTGQLVSWEYVEAPPKKEESK